MNKRSFFQIGCLPVIFLILCACKGNGCSGNDCMDECWNVKSYRQFWIKINDFETAVFFNKMQRGEITEEEYHQRKNANYRFIAEHHTLSWKATDKNGEIISGTLNPSIIDVDNIDIEYKIGKNDKWIQDLETPPVFTVHVDGGDYEDAVFTIDETFFSSKRRDCDGGYTAGDYKNAPCLYLYKKQSCQENETVCHDVQYTIDYVCAGYGFKLLQPEDEAHE